MGLLSYIALLLAIVLINLIAWNSTAFCDWYIAHIFPIWVNTYGRLTDLFGFSVGERLIIAGLKLVVLAVLVGPVLGAIYGLARWIAKKRLSILPRIIKGFYAFFAWVFLAVCLVMTLNCFVLYHASTFSETYFGEDDREYSLAELIPVYNEVARNCNELAKQMQRDENGIILYPGSTGEMANASYEEQLRDMTDQARGLMQTLGETYPQLDGYYPRPKALTFSDFMCQQYMAGYYFPFSMEANYNDVMYYLNIPATMCHELAHLRGYIYEDEANFIAYLASTQSEDLFIRYSGYLSVLVYLHNDLWQWWYEDPEAYVAVAQQNPPLEVSQQVWQDNIFVMEDEWDRINEDALVDTEVVEEATDAFIDTTLKVNGVSDGKISYSRVVKLLLQYFYRAK
jgi:hypothetical protein